MKLEKYSFGTGDRFGQQGSSQLQAVKKASEQGVDIAIVWNKSHREHVIVGTKPDDVRREADEAVEKERWQGGYYVDADHINLSNVDGFLDCSDFFTIDVADFIGERAEENELISFIDSCLPYAGELFIEGIPEPLVIREDTIRAIAENYLYAARQAADINNYVAGKKGAETFITEVSMDETDEPQTPEELFFILAALARYQVPLQTIAPKFTGRFNKGIDYIGDVEQFNQEFNDDLCVIRHAVAAFSLPGNLKLSVHSGSDKFSIYPGIRRAIDLHQAGVHVKTAGTTWLEELIGLAESGGAALDLVKDIYRQAYGRFPELCGPYSAVIDIDRKALPDPDLIDTWDSGRLARAIRHEQVCAEYDSNIRQLLHVGYKVAAEYGETYLQAVRDCREVVGKHVCENLFKRHITPLFL